MYSSLIVRETKAQGLKSIFCTLLPTRHLWGSRKSQDFLFLACNNNSAITYPAYKEGKGSRYKISLWLYGPLTPISPRAIWSICQNYFFRGKKWKSLEMLSKLFVLICCRFYYYYYYYLNFLYWFKYTYFYEFLFRASPSSTFRYGVSK